MVEEIVSRRLIGEHVQTVKGTHNIEALEIIRRVLVRHQDHL